MPERDYYFRTGEAPEKTRTQYVQHIANMLKLMGEPEAKAGADAQAIMKLETALAKVSMDITSRRNPNKVYHLMPVSELANLAGGTATAAPAQAAKTTAKKPAVKTLRVAKPTRKAA